MMPHLSANEAALRAKRGVEFLDRKLGWRWRKKIDVATLDLSSPCNCIEGQIFGGLTNEQFNTLGRLMEIDESDFGFNLPPGVARSQRSWARLTEAWIKELSS